MKTLNTYIEERLVLSKNKKPREYTEHPTSNEELRKLIKDTLKTKSNECSLNHIDVSRITDF